ncbi:MAG TPA: SRPBCC family protein [Puia sp.]|nr:SRPBCC family protein [Puia sp.]
MRFIKLFFISVVVLFLVLLGISLMIPKHIRISRAVDIMSTKQKVFNAINDMKTWDSWNQFTANSALTNKIFSNPSNGYPALMKADQLSVIITDSKPDSIKTSWDQLNAKHFDGCYNIMELRPGTITVQWYFDFHFKWYPWEKFTSLVYDKQLGPVMEESLTNLKHYSESNP